MIAPKIAQTLPFMQALAFHPLPKLRTVCKFRANWDLAHLACVATEKLHQGLDSFLVVHRTCHPTKMSRCETGVRQMAGTSTVEGSDIDVLWPHVSRNHFIFWDMKQYTITSLFYQMTLVNLTSWWLNHPIWKKCAQVKLDHFLKHPSENKHIWNHQVVEHEPHWAWTLNPFRSTSLDPSSGPSEGDVDTGLKLSFTLCFWLWVDNPRNHWATKTTSWKIYQF